jgi:hypothetical protein
MWHRQLHIFGLPFYYIEYGIAQLGALQMWLQAKRNPVSALGNYKKGLALGASRPLPDLFAASGLKILFNRVVGPRFVGKPGNEALALEGEAELPPIFDYIESVAPAEGWLVEGGFSIADITVASMLCTLRYVGHGPNAASYPKTAAWHARALARPSWQAVEAKETALIQRILPDLAIA